MSEIITIIDEILKIQSMVNNELKENKLWMDLLNTIINEQNDKIELLTYRINKLEKLDKKVKK